MALLRHLDHAVHRRREDPDQQNDEGDGGTKCGLQ
jgi:hypothetical protein